MPSSPACIGLTGGIGSGKSAALQAFHRRGAAVLSADEVVHRLYADPVVVQAVRAQFGDEVLAPDGSVDRPALGAAAMSQSGGMAFLEGLLHPRISDARTEWIAEQRARVPQPPLMVCEVPLLFEVGLQDAFDAVLVVTASDDVRRARVAARGQDFDARAALQWDEDRKVAAANAHYVNDGTEAALDAWAGEMFVAFAADGAS
jgi:dephospho-CoA kinase